MSKYKIGEVAKHLDVSNDTLRYYERLGLVKPHKDNETGYRYYDAWDINFLLDSKRFRSYDFSLSDINEIINSDDLITFDKRCNKRQRLLKEKIESYQQKLEVLSNFYEKVRTINNNIGQFKKCNSPSMIFLQQRANNDFNFSDELLPYVKEFSNLMPLTSHTFKIPCNKESNDLIKYYWGFSIPPDEALCNNIKLEPPKELIHSKKCIYSMFSAGTTGTFINSFQTQVLRPIQDYGYSVNDDIIGNLIVRLHEGEETLRIFEVWVPIIE